MYVLHTDQASHHWHCRGGVGGLLACTASDREHIKLAAGGADVALEGPAGLVLLRNVPVVLRDARRVEELALGLLGREPRLGPWLQHHAIDDAVKDVDILRRVLLGKRLTGRPRSGRGQAELRANSGRGQAEIGRDQAEVRPRSGRVAVSPAPVLARPSWRRRRRASWGRPATRRWRP